MDKKTEKIPAKTSDIRLANENSELQGHKENLGIEIPKASELADYKDPRLKEFEGSEKFEEALTHLPAFNKDSQVTLGEFDKIRYEDYFKI